MSTTLMRARLVAALAAWHGLSRADLGRLLGHATQTMYKKLDGRRDFTTRDLEILADAFDIDPALLIRPQSVAAVLGTVREPAADLLTCTFKVFPQVRGVGEPPGGIPAKSALFPSLWAA